VLIYTLFFAYKIVFWGGLIDFRFYYPKGVWIVVVEPYIYKNCTNISVALDFSSIFTLFGLNNPNMVQIL